MAVAMFRGVGRALYGRIQRLHDVGGFNHPIYNYIYISLGASWQVWKEKTNHHAVV